MRDQLEVLLEERVRPHLRSHGGEAEIISYEDGVLCLRLLGACSTCPAALLTNESLIEEELCKAVPELSRVVLQQDISDELLAQAKKLMTRGKAH